MRNFDLYGPFVFSDVCMAQRSSCESYSSKWSQNFWALPRNRCRFRRLDVLRYATQLSYIFHYCFCTFHHSSSAFYLVVPQLSSAETSTLCRIYTPFQTYTTDIRENAISHKVISCKYLSKSFCTAVDWSSQANALQPLGVGGSRRWSGFCSQFCTRIPVVPETALVSSRTLSFCFPLIANSFSSFNTTESPATRYHCSCLTWRQSFVIEISDLCFSSPSSSTSDIGHRYLFMNFHVVQF